MLNGSEKSFIILEGVLLTGIEDISFDYSITESSTRLLAKRGINRKIYGPPKVTCRLSKPYNGADFFQSLTGFTNLSGQFVYEDNAIDFTDACISSYGLNLDSNGFGKVDVDLSIFGDLKPTQDLKTSTAESDFQVLDKTPPLEIFNLDQKVSAIKSLDYKASFDIKPNNEIGGINASKVSILSPVSHKISADIEMLEQEVEDVTGLVDNNNLTKNISMIFALPENSQSVIQIKEIQEEAENIQSSGVDLSDLDFSFGSCALNAFQFKEASISQQNLNSKAGEVLQLSNDYSAYSTVNRITRSIVKPTEIGSCLDQVNRVLENIGIARNRFQFSLFGNVIDFENKPVGETNENLFERIVQLIVPKTGEDFELAQAGEYLINMRSFVGFGFAPVDRVDFEEFSTGETGLLGFVDIYFENQVDFEDRSTGETNQDLY